MLGSCVGVICTGTNTQTQQGSGSTIEAQGTGRKRGHSDRDGVDSEPGKYSICSYHKVSAASSPTH